MEVKTYRVKGRMLLSHDKFPEWRSFNIEVRAVKEEDAVSRVYSELGSRHKLKRYNIKIESVEEVPPESIRTPQLAQLASLEGWDKP